MIGWSVVAAIVLQTMVAVTTIAQGSNSHVMAPQHTVVRTLDEWQVLWTAHSARPAPVVDFSQSIVAAVFLGSRPTAGYRVEITAVTLRDGTVMVDYVEHGPPPDALVAQVVTSPFCFVSIPRETGDVEFRKVGPRAMVSWSGLAVL